MLSSPLIVFTDKVTDTQTDRQTKVITIPLHILCGGVKRAISALHAAKKQIENPSITASVIVV